MSEGWTHTLRQSRCRQSSQRGSRCRWRCQCSHIRPWHPGSGARPRWCARGANVLAPVARARWLRRLRTPCPKGKPRIRWQRRGWTRSIVSGLCHRWSGWRPHRNTRECRYTLLAVLIPHGACRNLAGTRCTRSRRAGRKAGCAGILDPSTSGLAVTTVADNASIQRARDRGSLTHLYVPSVQLTTSPV